MAMRGGCMARENSGDGKRTMDYESSMPPIVTFCPGSKAGMPSSARCQYEHESGSEEERPSSPRYGQLAHRNASPR